MNTEAWATVPVEGPVSASPFSGEYGGIDLVSPSDEPKSHLFLVHFSVLFLAIFE